MKRRVRVRLERFTGHGRHVHLSMAELDEAGNPVAESQRYMNFADRAHAIRWVNAVFAEQFDHNTHELCYEKGPSREWFYRDGD